MVRKRFLPLTLFLLLTLCACGSQSGASVRQYSGMELMTLTGREAGHAPVALSAMDMSLPDPAALETEINALMAELGESESVTAAFDCLMRAKALFDDYDSRTVLFTLRHDSDPANEDYKAGLEFCEEHYEATARLWGEFYWALDESPYRASLLPLWYAEEDTGLRNYNSYRSEQLLEEITARSDEAAALLGEASVLWAGGHLTFEESLAREDWMEAASAWLDVHGPALLEHYAAVVNARSALARECYRLESFSHYAFADYRWDYAPESAGSLIDDIVTWLLPLDDELTEAGYWARLYESYLEREELVTRAPSVFAAMGADMAAAFSLLMDYELWVSEAAEGSYRRPYANYLPAYRVGVLFCPYDGDAMSVLRFSHEFGHFYEYYCKLDDYSRGLDLSELHSQGMTLLFAEQYARHYGEDDLRALALVDLVDTLVYQSYNAAIELAAYALPEGECDPAELLAISREVDARFGYGEGDSSLSDYYWLTDEELFADPFRSFGYVTSAGAALELWALARTDMDGALRKYDMLTRHRRSEALTENLRWAQVKSPFTEDWAEGAAGLLRAEFSLPAAAA